MLVAAMRNDVVRVAVVQENVMMVDIMKLACFCCD